MPEAASAQGSLRRGPFTQEGVLQTVASKALGKAIAAYGSSVNPSVQASETQNKLGLLHKNICRRLGSPKLGQVQRRCVYLRRARAKAAVLTALD